MRALRFLVRPRRAIARPSPPALSLARPSSAAAQLVWVRAPLAVGWASDGRPSSSRKQNPSPAPSRNPSSIPPFLPFFSGPEWRRPVRLAGGERLAPPLAFTPPRRAYPTAPWPGTSWGLSFFSSRAAPFWSLKPRRRARRDGGAAVAPLAGARVWPEPRAALSSGTSVVPFGAVRVRSGRHTRRRPVLSRTEAVEYRQAGVSGVLLRTSLAGGGMEPGASLLLSSFLLGLGFELYSFPLSIRDRNFFLPLSIHDRILSVPIRSTL
jgi:hypothetical protein